MIPFAYNLRSLFVRSTTTLATMFGISFVVFVLAVALMLSAGVKKTMSDAGRPDMAIVLRQGSDSELGSVIENQQIGVVLGAAGVKHEGDHIAGAAEVVVVATLDKLGTDGIANVTLRGMSEDSLRLRPEIKIVAGRMPKAGSDEVMVGARLRGRFRGLDLDQSFDLRKNRPVKVVGIFEAKGSVYESEVWVDYDALRDAYRRLGAVSSIRVRLESPEKFTAFQIVVEQDKRLGLKAYREAEFYEKASSFASGFVTVLGTVIAVFFSIAAMMGASITMYSAVANREREIGILRAIGFSRTMVLASFLLESTLLALGGGLIGILAALGMGFVKLSMMNFSTFSELVFTLEPTPQALGIALLFAGGMGLLGGFLPAVKAARVSPVTAMRQ